MKAWKVVVACYRIFNKSILMHPERNASEIYDKIS